ncbi:hypothetical protein EVAR_43508_1 [Eumeta japonica]|uniref:Uncharacterized protein n=1 Tax=Eumeta variegata TaxID=151549 RepID=A0A4C1YL58_EUMVA|nr:hypothetical protein EVAR_43508_1 [Eumeta japonica]
MVLLQDVHQRRRRSIKTTNGYALSHLVGCTSCNDLKEAQNIETEICICVEELCEYARWPPREGLASAARHVYFTFTEHILYCDEIHRDPLGGRRSYRAAIDNLARCFENTFYFTVRFPLTRWPMILHLSAADACDFVGLILLQRL